MRLAFIPKLPHLVRLGMPSVECGPRALFFQGHQPVSAMRKARAPQELFDGGVPILGICYGQQVMSHQLGGEVRPGHETGEGEFGKAYLTVTKSCTLFEGLWKEGDRQQVWMSHGDKVTKFADGFRNCGD